MGTFYLYCFDLIEKVDFPTKFLSRCTGIGILKRFNQILTTFLGLLTGLSSEIFFQVSFVLQRFWIFQNLYAPPKADQPQAYHVYFHSKWMALLITRANQMKKMGLVGVPPKLMKMANISKEIGETADLIVVSTSY